LKPTLLSAVTLSLLQAVTLSLLQAAILSEAKNPCILLLAAQMAAANTHHQRPTDNAQR
jgi:hypothetical protein